MNEEQLLADETVQVPDDLAVAATDDAEIPAPATVDTAYECRRRRIFDHRAEAQADPSTMTACLAGVSSDLFDIELWVVEMIRPELTPGASIEEIERHMPAIDLVLRLSKQISQITQLEQRTRKSSSETSDRKPQI